MLIEEGTKYQISQAIKRNFNSAEMMTIVRNDGSTVQFTLGEGKSYGSMPIEHFHYLLKRENLTLLTTKRGMLKNKTEKQIG